MMGIENSKILNTGWIKYTAILVTFFISIIAFSTIVNAAPKEIKVMLYDNGEEQIKYAVASDPAVIKKWAELGNLLGFSWCYGTKSQKVGEDFCITKASNGDYILQANYNSNDPFAAGAGADKRLKIILSNFKIDFSSSKFKWKEPSIVKSKPIINESYVYENPASKESKVNKQYQYVSSGKLTYTTNYSFGDKIKLTSPINLECNFGEALKKVNFTVSSDEGWKNSEKLISENIKDNFVVNIPPYSKRTIESVSEAFNARVNYSTTANVTYNVTLVGFLKESGNAKLDHPTDDRFVELTLGDNKMSAANALYDLYQKSGTSGYNSFIDWNWLKVNNSNYKDIVESKIYKSPEFLNVNGQVSYSGSVTQLRNKEAVSLSPNKMKLLSLGLQSTTSLSRISLSGTIPNLYPGDSYNLSQLYVIGYDQYDNSYYIPPEQITFSIESGGIYGSITNNFLKANMIGKGSLSAIVQNIRSNAVNFNIIDKPVLSSLTLNGTIPSLNAQNSYDLTGLTLKGFDQYGNSYPVAGTAAEWQVVTGNSLAGISGSIIKANPNTGGTGAVVAKLLGVTSNPINFTVQNTSVLQSLRIEGIMPTLYVGDTFNLSQLSLKGIDQFGNTYNISNLPVTFAISSGGNSAVLDGSLLRATAEGTVSINATVSNITSNTVNITVRSRPILKSVTITGSIPVLTVGNSYNLSQLTITGKDQFSNPYNLSSLPKNYYITSGTNFAAINGNNLIAYADDNGKPGYGNIALSIVDPATNLNVRSNSVGFTVKNPLILSSLTVAGFIPSLYVGDRYDLSRLTVTGRDQYGDNYNLSGMTKLWQVVSGGSYGYISGNSLVANSQGTGGVVLKIGNITSNSISFAVYNNSNTGRTLSRVVITSSSPTLYIGNSYNLSNLSLYGYDQYGEVYNLSGQAIYWNITSGWNCIGVSGNILTANAIGSGAVTATINNVISNPITFNVLGTQYNLINLTISGSIPTLSIGDSFDLSKLTLTGQDLYGNTITISGPSVTWLITSGNNAAIISGNNFKALASGSGTLTASIYGIRSNQISFTVKDKPILKALTLVDTKPVISYGKKFELSQLILNGTDQYGNSYNINGLPITWYVTSTKGSIGVSGNTLISNAEDSGTITATIQNITSNPIGIKVVKDPQVLTSLELSGVMPTLKVGEAFNLTNLELRGIDQYGETFNLANQTIVWNVPSSGIASNVSGNILTPISDGIGTISATVLGVTSNSKTIMAIKEPPVLKTLTIQSTILTLTVGVKFDLSKLSLTGKDQYGNPYNISGNSIIWKDLSVRKLAYITGRTIMPIEAGTMSIAASVMGVTSKPFNIVIKSNSVLKTVTIAAASYTLNAGKSYDLSRIIMSGKDQFGKPVALSGREVVWKTVSGGNLITISGKILRAKGAGTAKILAVVSGVTSNTVTLIIK